MRPNIEAPRSGREALSWARQQHTSGASHWHNMCQMFVRSCFGVPSYYGSAIAAWYGAEGKHRSFPPPAGVPVFFGGGQYGHVAISAGGGYCWSSDVPYGRVGKVGIYALAHAWGKSYLGWTEDINERRVWLGRPVLDISEVIAATRRGRSVANGSRLKKAVAKEVGAGEMNPDTSTLGPNFRNRYVLLQRKWYPGSKADGIPGPTSLRRLAAKNGWAVRD